MQIVPFTLCRICSVQVTNTPSSKTMPKMLFSLHFVMPPQTLYSLPLEVTNCWFYSCTVSFYIHGSWPWKSKPNIISNYHSFCCPIIHTGTIHSVFFIDTLTMLDNAHSLIGMPYFGIIASNEIATKNSTYIVNISWLCKPLQ